MSDEDYVRGRIALMRGRAKFVRYSHSSEFIDPAAELGEGFHFVVLYDEKIDSNVISGPRGPIVIQNTYLSSFAYNLFLCWLLRPEHFAERAAPEPEVLLAHNFKKFFAEQLIHGHDGVFSRAIFLETLLFEQVCMVPVFEAKSRIPTLGRRADLAASLMSSALSFHELGHYLLKRDPNLWDAHVQQHPALEAVDRDVVNAGYTRKFVEEFRCDALSVISCLQQYGEQESREFCLRAISFAFAAFAVLSSLAKSAESTSENHRRVPDEVDLRSIEKVHREFGYSLGIDEALVERARLVIRLCDEMMRDGGGSLFADGGSFPLPPTIVDDLLGYVDRVMESDDRNAREMSLLVAEALHEHPRGLEFLYLRSKTFSGADLPGRVE